MKIAVRSLVTALLATGLVQISAAQMMGMRPPSLAGVFTPVVGSGASYEMLQKNGQKTSLDITIVDKESGGYWMEMSMQMPEGNGSSRMPMGGTSYAKELLVRQGDDLVIQRIIVQMPGRPPMDMSSMPHAIQSKESKADIRANAQNLGTESITTPGTFSCQHWRDPKNNDDYWISDKVSPWQLVKMTSADKNTVTLTKLITGAKSHITGTPVSMQEMMKGMGQ
jgi:hypothetical protein